MKVAVAVCLALLAVVLVQAKDEMAPQVFAGDTRVANERPAAPRQFPYMAWVSGYGYCAGSLITRSAVLTAAYCVASDGRKHTVRLGSIYRTGEDGNAWTVESIFVIRHPKYSGNMDNNIAIIHLPRLAPVNEFIQPVYLPCSPVVSSYLGRQAIVDVWGPADSGLTHALLWAKVVVIPNHYCKQFTTSYAVTDRQLCTSSFNATAGWRDGGGPLVLNIRGRYIQIGIISWHSSAQYNTTHPFIYTRVTSYLNWIKLNTESD